MTEERRKVQLSARFVIRTDDSALKSEKKEEKPEKPEAGGKDGD